jgi:hypothetical protein
LVLALGAGAARRLFVEPKVELSVELNCGKRITIRRRRTAEASLPKTCARNLGVVTVFALFDLVFVLFDVASFYGLQFERTGGDDFKVGTALGARDHFAFVDAVLVDIQIGFAFGAQNHKASLAD